MRVGLRSKLLMPFMLGSLALTIALAGYTYRSSSSALEDAVHLISEAKTNQTESSISVLLKSISSALQYIVSDPHISDLVVLIQTSADNNRIQDQRNRTSNWLYTLTQGNNYYRELLVLDKNAICVASSNESYIGESFAKEEYAKAALKGIFNFGNFSIGKFTKQLTVYAAGPIDGDHGVTGAFVVISDMPQLVNYEDISSHKKQTLFTSILAPDGEFVAHRNPDIMGNPSRKYKSLYNELKKNAEAGSHISYKMDNQNYVGYARLDSVTNWIIITSGPKKELFASAYDQGVIVFVISFSFFILTSFFVINVTRGVLRSLLSLITYAKNVSEGDFEQELPTTQRQDEIGILHNSLKRLVTRLRAMLQETEAANKMKDEFLANMSHEMRTPLNAILGMAHLSLREGNLPPKHTNYLDKINLAAKSLLGVINDILDMSKVEAGKLSIDEEPFDLRKTIAETLDIHRDSAKQKDISLAFEYKRTAPHAFMGDSLRIRQILNNLIGNAIKFTEQGKIFISCWQDEEASDPLTTTMWIAVKDTGVGIPQNVLPKLFTPFTQADASITRRFGGTGLGLAICHHLVRLMGGEISVKSEENEGSEFAFYLKLKPSKESDLKIESHTMPSNSFTLEGKNILLAEDNEINQLIVSEMIAPFKANVVVAENGQKAVEAVRTQIFDLILMDMQMPIMGGLEATKIIRTMDNGKTVPIVAVTANARNEDKTQGMEIGMNDYLTKPIDPQKLVNVLQKWLLGQLE